MRFGRTNSFSGNKRPTHEVGEGVRVLYPVGAPEEALIADATTIVWHLFFMLFSAIPFSIGVFAIRSDRKEQDELGWSTRRF